MEEKQRWRLKKFCCCMPLRSGTLLVAYLNASVIFLMHFLRDYSPAMGSMIEMVFRELEMDIDAYYMPYLYMLPLIMDYVFALILIHALHKNNASLLLAYMCYVLLYICCQLLNLLSYFNEVYFYFVGTDTIYFIYVLLLVYSVRVEILHDKMDLLSPPQQASEVTTTPTTAPPPPLAQPNNMAAEQEKTSL